MPDTGRMFICARCRAQVVICRDCDRGQIYCTRACAEQARGASLRAAGRRYQASRAGRFAHAARSHRYRARRKIVTHQGSVAPTGGDLLPAEAVLATVAVDSDSAEVEEPGHRCHVCNGRCAPAVRLGFVRHRQPRATPTARPHEHPS